MEKTLSDVILVADNEPDILRFLEVNLQLDGYEVVTARDGEETLERAFELRPALVLLDVMMPRLDGFEVCRRLRADVRTSHVPIIMLTAKSLTMDKVLGLSAGADDYVIKPFDPMELLARVGTTLQRAHELRGSSPLTGLPGNHRIRQEIASRFAAGEPLAVVHADLNFFKSFNDQYGFLRGDDVIGMTAEVLQEALRQHADSRAFVGHIGGDDFMVVCGPQDVAAVCGAVVKDFDERIPAFYDPEDAARGTIEIEDRRGEVQHYGFVSIALGVATTEQRRVGDHRELIQAAQEMKTYLKRYEPQSAWARDERGTASSHRS